MLYVELNKIAENTNFEHDNNDFKLVIYNLDLIGNMIELKEC